MSAGVYDGLWLTIATRGFQFRILPHALSLIFTKHNEKCGDGDISNFQALMTALAATVGTGILIVNAETLPKTFALILRHAFSPTAASGGFVGAILIQTIRAGLARGLFSNESGLGSSPIVAAAARTTCPVTQAMISMTQTFIDTLVVCTLTALIILSSGSWTETGVDGNALTGLALTAEAFSKCYGTWGKHLISLTSIFFAWSTLLGWSYYGEKALEYLGNGKGILFYRLVYLSIIYFGCTLELNTVWTISDIFNGLMAFPNLIALVLLSPFVIKTTRDLCESRRQKKRLHSERV